MVAGKTCQSFIDTLRLRIRLAREADAIALSQMMSAVVSARLASWRAEISARAMQDFLRDQLGATDKHRPMVLERREDGTICGWLSVSRHDADPQLGILTYWLGEAHHGQGLMREAAPPAVAHLFTIMGLSRMRAAVQPDNSSSISVLEAIGMRFRDHGSIWCLARDRFEACLWFEMGRPKPMVSAAMYGMEERHADVAESVDASDFNWSARGEIPGAEPLKFGER